MDVTVAPVSRLSGRISVPGDKSISHRAAIIGAISSGITEITGFLRADDCLRTLACLRDLGVRVEDDQGQLVIHGAAGRLLEPARVLDAGNSGTTMRLLAGVLAAQPFTAELDGDESLRRRPMDRLADPLRRMGAHVGAREGRYPPLRIMGAQLRGITYEVPVASAQVKSAVLLAGVSAAGETTVIEPVPTRDHTERMLAGFGVPVRRENTRITITPAIPRGSRVAIPGDISSAAFFLAAAAAIPGSELTVENVGVNPTRTGVLDAFRGMGAPAIVEAGRDQSWEPVGNVSIRGRRPRAVAIDGALIPRLIDELPVLCILGAVAEGRTVIRDASELRVKESDRIGVLVTGLRALGVSVQERPDGMEIEGGRLRGGTVDAAGDHRIAMAFAIAGLLAEEPVTVRGAESVAVSFPGFFETLEAVTGRKPVVSGAGSNG
jgi:3-phosphoshikimate 1-carboxyvinyltransferase